MRCISRALTNLIFTMGTRAPGQRQQISQELYEKYTKNTIRSNRNDSTGTWTNENVFRLIVGLLIYPKISWDLSAKWLRCCHLI